MLKGLVQDDHPLTIGLILERMRRVYGASEVATLTEGGIERATFSEIADRVDRLAGALAGLGISGGDRVATFAWNTQRHLEVYFAAPCMGAVLHTLNIRLFEEQLTYIANHAEDQVVFVEDSLVPILERVAPSFETVRHYVVMGDGDAGSLPNVIRYEELLADQKPGFDYPELDDRQAAGLCYTSGTTGNPKGVLYSHRSNLLHAFGTCLADAMGLSASDRMLPVVPMFHANAWGIPYAAGLTGADLVMPDRFLQPEPIARLIAEEKVTISAAVPTIWMDLLRYSEEHEIDLSSIRQIICGGSAVPLALMQEWDRRGVKIVQAWGMTETSPLGSMAHPPADTEGEQQWSYRASQGRLMPCVEARLIGSDGQELAWDGHSTGELEVRGPWIASDYYNDPTGAEKFHDGWLRTGDIASIDDHGFIRISDRAKDVIKSGGEWISSVELEGELMAHPGVAEAAVIAKPDERWQERPLACVVRREGSDVGADELASHLADRVAKWWIPDEFAFIDEVPKTSVGKFDKKVLRQQLTDGQLEDRRAAAQPPRRPLSSTT
ncbi:MAG TPA: long-chain fatty acid--CoA ligase [Solirubrobacteraceae bacterium]|jgi:fatty-acyl-CoA synthase|nr:long-chain fatty acid--CoA ligase [Solirubrobacteraceae bacterium]